jgi:hypothetical protein
MKKLLVVVPLALIAALSTLLWALAPPAQALPPYVKGNVRVAFEIEAFPHPCTGERLDGNATVHFVAVFLEDANDSPTGNGLHLLEHFNAQGHVVSRSGTEYVALDREKRLSNVKFRSASVSMVTRRLKFISQGSGTPEDNFTLRVTYRLTTTANNEVVVEVDTFEGECR